MKIEMMIPLVIISMLLMVIAIKKTEKESIKGAKGSSKNKYYVDEFIGKLDNGEEYVGKRVKNRFLFFVNGKKVNTFYYDDDNKPLVALLRYNPYKKKYTSFAIDKDVINIEFKKYRFELDITRNDYSSTRRVEVFEVLKKS